MPRGFGSADIRIGAGRPAGDIEMPTFDIPGDCSCTWNVIRPGPGRACISRLSYRHALCRHRHTPQPGTSRSPAEEAPALNAGQRVFESRREDQTAASGQVTHG